MIVALWVVHRLPLGFRIHLRLRCDGGVSKRLEAFNEEIVGHDPRATAASSGARTKFEATLGCSAELAHEHPSVSRPPAARHCSLPWRYGSERLIDAMPWPRASRNCPSRGSSVTSRPRWRLIGGPIAVPADSLGTVRSRSHRQPSADRHLVFEAAYGSDITARAPRRDQFGRRWGNYPALTPIAHDGRVMGDNRRPLTKVVGFSAVEGFETPRKAQDGP